MASCIYLVYLMFTPDRNSMLLMSSSMILKSTWPDNVVWHVSILYLLWNQYYACSTVFREGGRFHQIFLYLSNIVL